MEEKGAGKLGFKFGVVNHSDADIGDLTLAVQVTTTAAKPEDPPFAEFEVKVQKLGPQELKEVTAVANTKLRAFELPDWQFIRAQGRVLSPAP